MTATIKKLGSFNTDQITLDETLIAISIPFTAKSEQIEKIIKESYNAFKKSHPEAANPRHEAYIFFNLSQQMQASFDFVVVIYDDEQEQSEYYDIDHNLSNETKEQIKKIVWGKMSELLFAH